MSIKRTIAASYMLILIGIAGVLYLSIGGQKATISGRTDVSQNNVFDSVHVTSDEDLEKCKQECKKTTIHPSKISLCISKVCLGRKKKTNLSSYTEIDSKELNICLAKCDNIPSIMAHLKPKCKEKCEKKYNTA